VKNTLREIEVRNFKSFGERGGRIKLGKITILTGKNNSGKSSFLEALVLLKQSIGCPDVKYSGDGCIVDFGGFDRVVHRGDLSRKIAIEINLDIMNLPNRDEIIKNVGKISRITSTDIEEGLSYRIEIGEDQYMQTLRIGSKTIIKINKYGDILEPLELRDIYMETGESRILYPPENDELKKIVDEAYKTLRDCVNNIYYISAFRGSFDWINPARETRQNYVGVAGEYSLLLLYNLFRKREERKLDRISEELKNFGLEKLISGLEFENKISADYRDETGYIANLKLAGAGSKQLLPIIVQLFCVNDSIIALEEPEISLHVEGQRDIVRAFAEAVEECKNRIIFTTHSNIPILSIPLVIESSSLSSEDIKIYHFERSKKTDYESVCEELELNKYGYLETPIPSYIEVEQELFDKWADSLGEDEEEEFE